MFKILKAGLFPLVIVLLPGCSSHNPQTPLQPAPPSLRPDHPVQQNTLYTNMTTYGQYMGCSAAQRNAGLPQTGWEQAPSLPGTYEEYLSGWREGFRKCRIGLGPVVPPDGVYP